MTKQDKKDKINQANNIPESSQIEELQDQVSEFKQGWQRTQADFDNARRRWDEEKKTIFDAVKLSTLLDFAPVLDNFERAFEGAPEDAVWLAGFQAIQKQIEEIYTSAGLTKIGEIGTEFNPEFHEALSQIESQDCKSGTVCQVIEFGWQSGAKVLRPAKVVVAK